MPTQRPVVISGPSGAGKSTLISKLNQRFPGQFAFSVSHTTRSPRVGEERDKAYHFVSRDEFLALVAADGFIEYTESFGNLYGTSVQAVVTACTDSRMRCIVDIDSVGVKNFKERCQHLNAIYIFVSPPSFTILESRLHGRGSDADTIVKARLRQCEQELAYARSGAYDAVIINDDLDRAFNLLVGLIEGTSSQGDDQDILHSSSLRPTD